ncbi:ankyrin repeat domain-containing protein [Brachyspira hyodysenteriae]|uniref:ankyrin repeat domain-containing protein n=1 Tax=Brachyspira hyodysenteriae TaxID=159 RepID=UPI002B25B62A|nr:ankyrin repeat domain-containing protein [Brachyspira hyodysenteriae]WPC25419.1 ankyrin repeat domain-containing protein [Brachyspira hyodysenteriae]
MRFILFTFLLLILLSCSQKSDVNVDENIKNNETSIENGNIVQDLSLEDAIAEYEESPCIDIIKNLISSGNINSTLTETTNIVNTEDTEYDLSVTFDEGTTALMIASYYGYADLVNALIQSNADVNMKNKRNYTALLYATDIWSRQGIGIYDSNFNVVELLVMAKADVNAVNNYGWSPLFFAADNSNSDVAAFLVDNGANINAVSDEGITPLLVANDVETVKILSKTVNINKPNFAGVTPLISFAGREISIEAISILLENGADVNMVDKDGETALSYAIENGNFDAALILLENNANPNLAKKKAKDLANIARELGDEEVASILDKY